MAERIQGLDDSVTFQGDLAVKPGLEVYLYSITIAWSGVAAGEPIYLRNGENAAAPMRVPISLPAAAGTLQLYWPQGKYFPLGLFIDTREVGFVQGSIQYK